MCRLYVRGGADGKRDFGTRMKRRTQIVLVGALLVALTALSSRRRGADSDRAGLKCGSCCPLNLSLDGTPLPSGTNVPMSNRNTNTSPATNGK